MVKIAIGEFAAMLPDLNTFIGQEFIIVDEKKKEIVGMVMVEEAPKQFTMTVKYKRRKSDTERSNAI